MNKDKSWLLEKHKECIQSPKTGEKMLDEGYELALNDMLVYINQLDEPEVLSQEWIDKHAENNEYSGYAGVPVDDLKNLLVPKQDNGFVVFEKDKLDEEVQRMIDETYKAMNEKPVIPQFVAEYIEQSKKDNDSINQVFAFIDDKENKELWNWLFPSISDEKRTNQETFMRAWLDGYEVEKEKKYIIKFASSVFGTSTYGSIGTQNGKKIMQSVYGSQEGLIIPNQYTRREIEEAGSEYMIFAEEVTK